MQAPNSIGFAQIIFSISSWKIKLLKLLDYFCGSFIAWLLPPQKKITSTDGPSPARILIIRPGGIGDAIFLLPFLQRMRQQKSLQSIHILCEKRNQEVFLAQPHLFDQLFCYDDLGAWRFLIRQKYDLIIDTEQWHYFSAIVAYLLPHQYSAGFSSRALRTKLFNFPVGYDQDAYELENFQKLFHTIFPNITPLNGVNNSFSIPKKIAEWAQTQIPVNSVTIFLGASIPVRRITQTQCTEIIRFLIEKCFYVVLLGGNDVRRSGKKICSALNHAHILNFVGRISLAESAALIQQSRLFIGPDSGLMHLACAVGTPVIGIFGPGNLKKWAPQGTAGQVITENVSCSPCTAFGYTVPTCRGQYQCMRNIKTSSILLAAQKILSSS